MKITMMMPSGSFQLRSSAFMTASWSYKVGVWSESHGCPSFMLLVVFINILSLGSLFSPQSSQLHWIILHYGKCRTEKGSEPCVSNLFF